SNLVIRSIRDYFTTDMDEVLIDDPEVYREAREFFQMVMPDHASLVKQHQEQRPIFSRYQIEDQIETISSNKVNLPSGGSIVIDSTEALVAIDINSGKMSGEQGVEETATKTNLEAAAEIGRQLRLRDLGGLIVIDFIDMYDRKNIRAVEQQLKKSTAFDKARINIGRISQFGLLEMSRQRIKATLAAASFRTCPHCHGSGKVKNPEALAVSLLRRIHTGVAKGQVAKVDAQLPLEVASYLLNNKREELIELERRYRVQLHIHGRPDFLTDQIDLDFQKRARETEQLAEPVTTGMLQSLAEVSAVIQEKPAEKAIESAPSTTEGQSTEPVPAKKRRRRGGRKKSTATKPQEEQTAGAQPAEQAAKDATTDNAEGSSAIESPVEQATPSTAIAADLEPKQDRTVESAAVQQIAKPGAEETVGGEKKPRRRRAPRSKTARKSSADAPLAEAEVKEAASPPPLDEQSQPSPTEGTKTPKSRGRRRPAQPKTDQTQTEMKASKDSNSPASPELPAKGIAEEKPTAAAQPSISPVDSATTTKGASETESPKPKRSRPRAKKMVENQADPAGPATEKASSTVQPQPAESQDDTEKPKAKRPRSGRTTGTRSKKTATAQPETEQSSTSSQAIDKEPKKSPAKSTTRKTTSKKEEIKPESKTNDGERVKTAQEADKKKPTGTRKAPVRRKTKTDKQDQPPEANS
ncbi:MAG: hypothetical protein C0614_10260, partial [Desulfuromonas sp.]